MKSLAVGGTVNPSVTKIIYAMAIPLTLLSMDAISVVALFIQMSRRAFRAFLQEKLQFIAQTCVRRLQQQRLQRQLQQRPRRQQRQ